ncbi:MAG: PA14 domain-containing protein [Candidatus Promineifilaceae bacterium]
MAFWFWVVVLSILALGLTELYSWYKRKNNPQPEEAVEEVTAADLQAELARASMKIAMLESRLNESEALLEASETQREEDEAARAALEESYRERLDKTEKAYQRQMVTLSERLGNKGNGSQKSQQKKTGQYPVRMAAEVAAWRATLGGQALVETAVSSDADSLANDVKVEGGEVSAPPEAELVEAVVLGEEPPEPEDELLEQVVVLDEASDQLEIEETAVAKEAELKEKERHAAAAINDVSEDADAVEEEPDPAVEEIPPLENRWPELESIAMQRVMARQLGSEMDADYLDDEEFLRELGIETEEEELEEPAEQRNWTVVPLKETAGYANDFEYLSGGEGQQSFLAGSYGESFPENLSEQMWDEALFGSSQRARYAAAQNPAVNENSGLIGFEEEEAFTEEGEEEEIAAAEASILSRAPEPKHDAVGGRENGRTALAVSEAEEPALQKTSFVWERRPISWRAEYFNNTNLAGEPLLVRQDNEINFEWQSEAPAKGIDPSTFSVRWSGALPLEAGQYRFTAAAPDGLRLWLNDRLVISAWYDQSEQIYQREFAWTGGTMDVRFEHYENGGNAKAFMTWERVK